MSSQRPTFSIHHWISFIILMISLSVLIGSTQISKGKSASEPNPFKKLLKDLDEHKKISWKLVHNIDPYSNGKLIKANTDNPQFLILKESGAFAIFDFDQKRKGEFLLNPEEEKITFLCQEVNGEKLRGEPVKLNFSIEAYDEEKLILSWQGRHGLVKMVYKPQEETLKGEMDIPLI